MIDQILDGREKRYELEKAILKAYQSPILVATVNYPGPDKLNVNSLFIFNEMLKTLSFFDYECKIFKSNEAGPFFIGVLKGKAENIKRETVPIEDDHVIGRLFDIDVMDYPYRKVERKDIGQSPRKCLVCDETAVICVREKAHDLTELQEKIELLIEEAKNGSK